MCPIVIRVEPLESSARRPAGFDLTEPVVGFRNWRIFRSGPTAGELSSPYFPVTWHQRVLRAECRRFRSAEDLLQAQHAAPARACGCGICAYHTPTGDFSKVDFQGVSGIVTAWGRIEVDLDGMRVENARVEALGIYSRWSRRQKQAVKVVAGRLGVDLVELEDLGVAASDYGEALPASLLSGGGS
jgi:hypothetical protein